MEETKVKAVTVAVFVATFMAAIEGTIVSTAIPTIVSQLDGIELMNWIFSIYLLTSAVTVPIYGKLSDLYGRKMIFIVATLIFLVGSTLCGFATNMEQLIIFRAIQGIGAGGILPLTMTIIADIYPFEKRARVLGFMGSAWGIAGVFGPLLGGFLVDQLSWHWIFFINVPVGILTIILVFLYLKENVSKENLPIDFLGTTLFTVALLALLFALQRAGETLNWGEPLVLILFALAILLFVGFYFAEKRAKDPIMPFILFKNPVVLIGNLIGFFISAFFNWH
ncbi:EmrB/QacA family drug resistance transporter [Listeria fleischmannii subsp. fleischmannii LU2006-1]|nr:EmrB/QacA family drug resistance transporter [Listeria fleischmannii subsp. fleischmannii LU2006-1]